MNKSSASSTSQPSPAAAPVQSARPKVPPDERVPLKEKLAFGVGGIAGHVQIRADDFLLNPIFVLMFGISPAVMSTCGLIYRFWDAISDLFTGWLSDKTRSRWGRRKPYIFVGSILMSFVMPFLFFFDRTWNVNAIIAWMVGIQLLIFLFHSIWNIPYQCLLLESTPNSVERTNVAAWRGYVGVLSSMGMSWLWAATQLPIFAGPDGKPDTLTGTRWIFTGLAILVLVLGFFPLFVKERAVVTTDKQPLTELSLWQNIKLTLTNRPFLILVMFTFLMTISNTILWGLDFFTRFNYVFKADQKLAAHFAGVMGTSQTILSLAGIPIFQYIANRHGKVFAVKLVMFIGLFASLSTLVFYNPANPYLALIPGLLMTPGNSAIWVLIPSMTGDAVDHDEITTFRRREGSFQATFSWTFKLSGSIATAISGPLVILCGYDAALKGVVQPDNVVFNMRMMLAFVPAVMMVTAILMIMRYPLTTSKIAEVHEILAARRGSKQSTPTTDPAPPTR